MSQPGYARRRGRPSPSVVLAGAAVLASAALLLGPLPAGANAGLVRAAGVVVLGIGLWATGALPAPLTSIVFFLVALLFSVAPPEVVFAGFHAGAVWLVFGGLVLGTAAQKCGLDDRIAEITLRHLPSSYLGIVSMLALIGVVSSFLIPSGIGRIALLVPFAVGLCRRLGFEPGGRGYTGLVLATGLSTITPANSVLTSNLPQLVMAGAAESSYGIRLEYLRYLLLHFPVLGVASALLVVVLTTCLFRESPARLADAGPATPWTPEQRRLLAVMLGAVALWSTDSWHGIEPAWVALGAATLCLLPRVGVLDPGDMTARINLGPWFFVAGVVGLGAVTTYTGLGDEIGRLLLPRLGLAPGADAYDYAAIAAMGALVALVTTVGALPAVLTPLAQNLATASGWHVESVLMVQPADYSFFLLPYQMPPMVVTIALGGLALRPVVKVLALNFLLGALVVLPLHFGWGRVLGYF